MQFDTEKFKDTVEKYVPEIITCVGSLGMICSATMTSSRRLQSLAICYGTSSAQYQTYKRKVERMSRSNNWLKMHKQPMRRGLENKEAKGLF